MAKAAEKGGLDIVAINDHVVVPDSIASTYPYSDDGIWAGRAVGECLKWLRRRLSSPRPRTGSNY